MTSARVFGYYIIWHYTTALQDMYRLVGNYLWFVANFFSIRLLLRTLFAPWKRLNVSSGRGGEESFFGAVIINTLMRGVGFLVRLGTILLGTVSLLIVLAFCILCFILWLALPAIVPFVFFAGIGSLISLLGAL